MRNIGQSCTAANRFLVAEPVAAEFAERLAARMGRMRLGPGLAEGTEVGPLIDERQRRSVAELVEDARAAGASLLTGGSAATCPGYFFQPTVLAGVPAGARIMSEEVFGPVAPVAGFATEEEALTLANDTEYGLVAFLYTRDLDRALRVSERLATGMVGVNQGMVSNPSAPFGGVKQSGFGREGGAEGILEYLDTRYIAVATAEPPPPLEGLSR
jgi:succinate-semialdehyde dehydrogenase/glutarate-semialdehyde dehydrogenase